jgi:DNA topoisomerase-1
MQTSLVLVESPAKCKKIEEYLGPGYKVMATYGHFRKINNLTDIDVNNHFQIHYSLTEDNIKLQQIERIRKAITHSYEIIIATDADREGEAIGWHICDLFQLPIDNTKRIVFHEITESAIQHAITYPLRLNMSLVKAAQSRQILDMLIGYTISPILWTTLQRHSSLSAGRGQTPALRLVYENYLSIQASPGKIVHHVSAFFTQFQLEFLIKNFDNKTNLLQFLEECKTFDFIYHGYGQGKQKECAPEPLTTSTLLQLASNKLNMSPKETMKSAQQLYEQGMITYMRTDSKHYSPEFLETTYEYIVEKYGEAYVKDELLTKSPKKSKPNSDVEAHEAIRPVRLQNLPEENVFDGKTKKLYEHILQHAIQSCMTDAEYMSFNMRVSAPQKLEFVYSNSYPCFLGWKIAKNRKERSLTEERSAEEIYHFTANLRVGQSFQLNKISTTFQLIETKSHYTEAKLISMLEELGIGRPSTFSFLVDKIQEREYVKKQNVEGQTIEETEYILLEQQLQETSITKTFGGEHNKLVIQPLGIIVIEFLIEHFHVFFNYEYTKNMEQKLDDIAQGLVEYQLLCHECFQMLQDHTKTKRDKFAIVIDNQHSIVIGKFGPVVRRIDSLTQETTFLPLKKDIAFETLLNSSEPILLENITNTKQSCASIGKYKNKDLFLKKGKYGVYAQWGNETKSLKEFNYLPLESIPYTDVLRALEKDNLLDPSKPVGLIRELNKRLSIRNGKYGDYIFYQKPRMKKPEFYKLQGFQDDYKKCDKQLILNWIKLTYNVE